MYTYIMQWIVYLTTNQAAGDRISIQAFLSYFILCVFGLFKWVIILFYSFLCILKFYIVCVFL